MYKDKNSQGSAFLSSNSQVLMLKYLVKNENVINFANCSETQELSFYLKPIVPIPNYL